MDPIAALSIASAAITFIDVGARFIKRLEELSESGDVPLVFRNVRTRIPLILSITTQLSEGEDSLPPESRENFRAVVMGCFEHVLRLDEILKKVTFTPNDSKLKKGLRAATSLVEESRVERISSALQKDLELLMLIKVVPKEQSYKAHQRRGSEALPEYFAPDGIFMIPFERDDHFIGREKVLAETTRRFSEQRRVSLVGPGGVGKSQIAIEYAYRFQEENPNAFIFWAYGGNESRFYQAYKRIAQRLKLPNWDDPDVSILELVSDWFESTSKQYLLILDNADDISMYWPAKYQIESSKAEPATDLSLYLPQTGDSGNLLITSRDARVAARLMKKGTPVDVHPMGTAEAKKLFLSTVQGDYSRLEESSIVEIVEALDCLPLAVTQAASFIDENGIPPSEYLEALKSEEAEEFLDEELHDSRRDEMSVNSAFRSWKVTFDQISKLNPRATDLLSLLAMFDRQSIPRWLVKSPGMVTSIGILQSLHMITIRPGSGSLQLHRLTQRFTQLGLKRQGTLQHYQEAALASVTKNYPVEIGVQEWEVCDLLAPHVQAVIDCEYTSRDGRLNLAELLCWSSDFDVERGMYQQALQGAKRSRQIFSKLIEPSDNRLASATWLYGRLVYYEAKSEDDVKLAEEVLHEALKTADPNSLNCAEAAFELAHLYFDIGKEKESLEMGKASYKCWEAMEGDSSVRSLDNSHDYSLELAMFGKTEAAVANWQQIIKLTPSSDASDNTKTVYTYRSMACIAEFQGDASTAELLYHKLVSLCSALYNPEHIHVFDYRLCHAESILRQDRYEDAVEVCQEILDICHNKSEWRIEATCLEIMAEAYRLMGDHGAEEGPRMQCLEIHEKSPGSNENLTRLRETSARCLMTSAQYPKARTLLEKAIEWREQQGENSENKLVLLELLAICLTGQGQYEKSEELFSRALSGKKEPDARVLNNLCCSLWNQKKWAELELRAREGLQLDSNYADQAHWMLIKALEGQGKTTEAVLLRAESVQLEDVESDFVDLRRRPVEPPYQMPERPRFGMIIHPRTWSA